MLQQTKIYKLRFQLEQWKIASKYLAIFLRFRIEYEKKNSTTVKEKIERLLKDEEIEVKVDQETVIMGIEQNEDNIWGLLVGTGYLKIVETIDITESRYKVKIPNFNVF